MKKTFKITGYIFSAILIVAAFAIGAVLVFDYVLGTDIFSSGADEAVLADSEVAVSWPYSPSLSDEEQEESEIELELVYIPSYINHRIDNSRLPWNLKLVNRYNPMHEGFQYQLAPIGGGHYFDYRAADALLSMLDAARADGLLPIVISSHRTVERQRVLFDNQVQRRLEQGMSLEEAMDDAARVVAYPGTSEHNLGLAVDIVSYHYRNLTANFGQTPEGIWLAQNAHHYGFVLRYPYHKQDITNIIYEPWHFRYVGINAASYMFYNDLVLEEYLVSYLR